MVKNLEVDLLILNDQSLFFDSVVLPLIDQLCAIRKGRYLSIPDKTLLLVHSQPNSAQFRSFVIDADGVRQVQSDGHN
jgi:hypothetical protein